MLGGKPQQGLYLALFFPSNFCLELTATNIAYVPLKGIFVRYIMSYREAADGPRHDRDYPRYGCRVSSNHHHPINLTFPMNTEQEPNIFLDLRDYFSSREPRSTTSTHHSRHSHHRDRDIAYITDHIHGLSTHSFAQQHSHYEVPAKQYRRTCTPPSPRHRTAQSASSRAEDPNYVSPWDKSDYQMIREGGWDNKRHFMESHGLSIYEPGDFDEVKDLLDDYRRVEDEAYRERTRSRYDTSPYAHRYTTYSEDNEPYDYYGSDSIIEPEDDERIESDGEGTSARRERVVYANESDHKWPDGEDQFEDDSETDASSDCDSTDAINYDTEPELDSESEGGLGLDDAVEDEYSNEYDDDSIG